MKHREAYTELHRKGHFDGFTILRFAEQLRVALGAKGVKTILDYGCGKGKAWSERDLAKALTVGHVDQVTLYDPGVEEFHFFTRDNKHDAVLCIDVLEHVPEEEVDSVLDDLFCVALKTVIMTFCARPAKESKNLPTGENAHVTQKPREWWIGKIEAAMVRQDKCHVPYYLFETE